MECRLPSAVLLLTLAFATPAQAADTDRNTPASNVSLPPAAGALTDLKFSEFFVKPFSPRGLVLTEKLRDLDGKRVRILGYMIQEDKPTPGQFLLSPYPGQIHDHDNALSDNLPPTIVHVSVQEQRDQPVPFTARLMALTGTLQLGNHTEASGRTSVVRLRADVPDQQTATLPSEKPSTQNH